MVMRDSLIYMWFFAMFQGQVLSFEWLYLEFIRCMIHLKLNSTTFIQLIHPWRLNRAKSVCCLFLECLRAVFKILAVWAIWLYSFPSFFLFRKNRRTAFLGFSCYSLSLMNPCFWIIGCLYSLEVGVMAWGLKILIKVSVTSEWKLAAGRISS